jgi:alkylation response protein AidB-like acyl-CoA dehydrogenase
LLTDSRFVYRIALSRLIGAEGMGLFQLIFPFYSLSLTIAASGICVAVSRLSAEYARLRNYVAIRPPDPPRRYVFLTIFTTHLGPRFLIC